MDRLFDLVDVFSDTPFGGNPLCVVTGADGLDAEAMLRITRWLNHSEATFLLPPTRPEADYRVRIFCLSGELPFAGHPTLGTCHAWLSRGGRPRHETEILQECGAGLVRLRRSGGMLAFAAPPLIRSGPVSDDDLDAALAVLRLPRSAVVDARWADNGPGWLAILLGSAAEVLAVEPLRFPGRHVDIGLVGPHPTGSDVAFELRAFFTDHTGTLVEDPVTGSLNASVGAWLFETGRARGAYLAAQGTAIARTGRIQVTQDGDGDTWVGGAVTTLLQGTCGAW